MTLRQSGKLRSVAWRWLSAARTRCAALRFVSILAVALLVGGAHDTGRAQAASDGEIVEFYLNLENPRTTICTGEKVTYTARVFRRYTAPPPGWTGKDLPNDQAVWGVRLEADSSNKTVGTFVDNRLLAITGGGGVEGPAVAEFEFVAKKPGSTNLYFQGAVRGYDIHVGYVTFTVPVRVIVCEYEVSTRSTWVAAYPNGTAFVFEFMRAKLTAVDDEGRFKGSSGVLWVYTNRIPNYGSDTSIGRGAADLDGRVDDDGRLVLNIKFKEVPASERNCGPRGCGGASFSVTADPLVVTLPADGKPVKVPHTAQGAGQSVSGKTTVTVKPVEPSR